MKILHVGNFKLGTENGSYNALWSLACAQAELGNDVVILRLGKLPSNENIEVAKNKKVKLIGYTCPRIFNCWTYDVDLTNLMKNISPDIVHLQYVRVPKFLGVSKCLKSLGIPYVISLHGGLNLVEMTRKRIRKYLYWYFVEKHVHRHSAGLHFVTNHEKEEYFKINKKYSGKSRVIYNAVEIQNRFFKKNYLAGDIVKFVYLGRYDIWHKGIDLIFQFVSELKKHNINAELHLYGSAGAKYTNDFKSLCEKYNRVVVYDHGFVSGDQKYHELIKYDFYIQYSRFELFGMSIAEALSCCVPVLISEKCDISNDLKNSNAGFVLSMDPQKSAEEFIENLLPKSNINKIGGKGREWVIENCSPFKVAKNMNELYEIIIL